MYRPMFPNTYSWVNLCLLARNSGSLIKPPGTGFQEVESMNFSIVEIGVLFLVWTYPWTSMETSPFLSDCQESRDSTQKVLSDVTQSGWVSAERLLTWSVRSIFFVGEVVPCNKLAFTVI